jgi:DNA repair protein SbcC/Rad50
VRPLSLTIEGLTSFRTLQEIDFSELDLFVITGSTGAGKSSILDAITFALYGNVPRVGGHELRDLISHGSSCMRVCLDFEVDGSHYRVARRMAKNSHQATLERVANGSSVTEIEQGGIKAVNARLEEIVGLDFKAFTKAVLLPQGAFDEFLRGDVSERRRILVRLLDLGRYEAAGQVARREATRLHTIVEERLSLIESNYQDATKERLRELESAVDAAREQRARVEKAKQEAKEVADGAAESERSLATLLAASTELEAALAQLQRLEEAWPTLEAEDRSTHGAVTQAEQEVAEAKKTLERVEEALAATAERTGDASALARLEAAANGYAREQAEIERLDIELAAAHEAAADLVAALDVAKQEDRDARKALDEVRSARAGAEMHRTVCERVVRCADADAALAKLDEELARAEQQAAGARARATEARDGLEHLEHEHAAVALRARLAPGDPCPVCESIVETLPQRDDDIESLLDQARRAAEAAEAVEQSATEAAVELKTRRRDAATEVEQARTALPAHIEVLQPTEARASLKRAEESLAGAQQAEVAAQTRSDAAARGVAEAKTESASTEATADGIATHREAAKQRLEEALEILIPSFGKKLPDDLGGEISRRRDEFEAAETTCKEAAAALEAARNVRDRAHQGRATCSERLSTFDQGSAIARTAARMACDSVARTLDDKALSTPQAEEDERAELISYWRNCCKQHLALALAGASRLCKTIDEAASELERIATKAGLVVTSRQPAEMAVEFEERAAAAHGDVVAAEKDVEALTLRIDEREKLAQEIADDRRLSALYDALARELRADHLVAFVLEESMNQLAAHASEELLRISDGRYSLIAGAGSFEVVDHHNADEQRSVATLSGGETFLASLSLALALSAGLRELAGTASGRLEAIFIDEGFGALDPETLGVVVDALERLREGDRMVGVITHVPTLAERIIAGLSIEKNGSSSRVSVR